MIIWSNVLNCVVDCVSVIRFWCFVVYWTHKPYNNSFWVIGGSKWGFWDEKGLWNRRFLVCPGEASLKRAAIVVAQNSEKSVRLSERQANKNLTFVIWFAQANFPSLKQNLPEPVVCGRRSSERQASLKRGKTKLSSFDSLKREAARLSELGPVRPFCVIFQSVPNPNLSFLICLLDLFRIV